MHKIPENIPAEDPDLNWEKKKELDEDTEYEVLRQQEVDDLGEELNRVLKDMVRGLK